MSTSSIASLLLRRCHPVTIARCALNRGNEKAAYGNVGVVRLLMSEVVVLLNRCHPVKIK